MLTLCSNIFKGPNPVCVYIFMHLRLAFRGDTHVMIKYWHLYVSQPIMIGNICPFPPVFTSRYYLDKSNQTEFSFHGHVHNSAVTDMSVPLR